MDADPESSACTWHHHPGAHLWEHLTSASIGGAGESEEQAVHAEKATRKNSRVHRVQLQFMTTPPESQMGLKAQAPLCLPSGSCRERESSATTVDWSTMVWVPMLRLTEWSRSNHLVVLSCSS